jgi:hypothetical protein
VRDGAFPPALLFAAAGLALAFTRRTERAASLLALAASAAAASFMPIPRSWLEGVYLALWTSVITTAASVHFAAALGRRSVALALSLNAGYWAGAVVHLSGSRAELLSALPCALIAFPASFIISRHSSVPVKVVSSWIIAVAVLVAALQLLAVTPGYLPDHLE